MIQSIEDGRKEDGNRSIADKIIKRLHDIDKTVENNQGRWAWELLQNAKDSIAESEDRTLAVQLILNHEYVEFRHTGLHFTEKDIRGLINQISSKEIAEGEHSNKTGKFGTGFLTTHLLSRVINVKGIVETLAGDFFSFEFPLDREGTTTSELIPKIENAWSAFQSSARKIKKSDNKESFNTSFSYHLSTKKQRDIASIGCDEFTQLIPYVLAFIPKIESVQIMDNTKGISITFFNKREFIEDSILRIHRSDSRGDAEVLILYKETEKASIATEVEKFEDGYAVKDISEVPKLFCDFPLIGSEPFHFPVVVNSFYFNPQTERDGVWLKDKKESPDKEVQENKEILKHAVVLFNDLLDDVSKVPFYRLYNLAETRIPAVNEKYFDGDWFSNTIQNPVRKTLMKATLVELEDPASSKQTISDVWFTLKSHPPEVRERLHRAIYDVNPDIVTKKAHLHFWAEKAWEDWNRLNYSNVAATIAKIGNIEALSAVLNSSEKESIKWLNDICMFICKDESNLLLFEKNALTPNQLGDFKKKSELSIDQVEDFTLVQVLSLLGDDWRGILLHRLIRFGEYHTKTKKQIASAITEKLKSHFVRDEHSIEAISLLSEWFENNKESGKELFSELYKKRAELFMNTIADKESLYKVMRSKTDLAQLSKIAEALSQDPKLLESIQNAEQLKSLLVEFNLNTIADLREMLLKQADKGRIQIEIDQDVLIGLGVTTLEELEEKLKDKDLAALFSHTSTPNAAMFLYVQKLIGRAKKNVIAHLRKLPQYDLQEMDEVAKTVIGGIRKDGLEIHVVVRPSDNGEVIVYYTSEKDTLDYANAELWIENGVDVPILLTLGKILKNTGINKIPVPKI